MKRKRVLSLSGPWERVRSSDKAITKLDDELFSKHYVVVQADSSTISS